MIVATGEHTPDTQAGRELSRYLENGRLNISTMYRTDVFSETLEAELVEVNPAYIIASGDAAVRKFLGPGTDMEMVHGIPYTLGRVVVIPCYSPEYGMWDDDNRCQVAWDYWQAGRAIRGEIATDTIVDAYPEPIYLDVDCEWDSWDFEIAAIDTEGVPGDEWSLQVSTEPGTGFVFRKSSPYFAANIARLAAYIEAADPIIVVHSALYDYEMCRLLGLDLFGCRLFDTMYAAYLLRVEPQGLKALAKRWCGMEMASYVETVGDVGIEKQLAYLERVFSRSWDAPEARVKHNNDGTAKLYKPQPVERRAEAIFADFYSGKLDKDGARCDPFDRWKKVDKHLRKMVESVLGSMPIGTLADIPLDDAIFYSGRDPDATLRLYYRLRAALEERDLLDLMAQGAEVLPIFEEMQFNGLVANRPHFEALRDEMWEKQCAMQSYISHHFFDGRPFNPNSAPQVATLMRRRGLEGAKKNRETGKVSTSKKSIEHLRYSDDAIAHVIDWREHDKIRSSFCNPILEHIPDEEDTHRVRCTIKVTRVASRRIAATDPPLLAIPVRHQLGLRVRDGFEAAPGNLLGSWDLSQIEMRYMAHLSRDPLLVQFFAEGRDVHAETAARIFGIRLEDVKEMDHRYPAKRAGFGIITNITGPGLLDQLRMFGCVGWTEDTCSDLIREWLKVYSGVARFLDSSRSEVRATGLVRDIWGHYRYLPGVWSDVKRIRAEAERAASSHKIQGGAQGMIQTSMAWLKPYIRGLRLAGADVWWILQIHDEIILEFEEDLWETLNDLVVEALTEHNGLQLIVPVKAKGSSAKQWGHLKG